MPPRSKPEQVIAIGTSWFKIRLVKPESGSSAWSLKVSPLSRKGVQLTNDEIVEAISHHECTVIKSVAHVGDSNFSVKLKDGYRKSNSVTKMLMELVAMRLKSLVVPASPAPTPIPAYVAARANPRLRGGRMAPLPVRR